MAAISPNGHERYWIDGVPYEGLRLHQAKSGTEKQWFDGLPNSELMPLENQDTGVQFFMFFD